MTTLFSIDAQDIRMTVDDIQISSSQNVLRIAAERTQCTLVIKFFLNLSSIDRTGLDFCRSVPVSD